MLHNPPLNPLLAPDPIAAQVFARRSVDRTSGSIMYLLKEERFYSYVDFSAITNPPSPPAGFARFHALTTQGFTRFEQDNEAATNITLGRDNVFIAKNTSGGTLSKKQVVYVTGSTGNVPNVALAKADALTTLPSIGIVLDDILNNNFGQIMRLGIISNIDTSAFTTGALLYVSDTVAGALTATRPTTPSFPQPMANVLVSGVGNGSLFVMTAPFLGNVGADSMLTKMSVSVGSTLTIPAGYCYISSAPFDAAGTVDAAGVLEVL